METIEDIISEEDWDGPPHCRYWTSHPLQIVVSNQQDVAMHSYLGVLSFESLKAIVEMRSRLIDAQYHQLLRWQAQFEEQTGGVRMLLV